MKIAVAGCGMRTPLLIYGLVRSGMPVSLISLYDLNGAQTALMAALGKELASESGTEVRAAATLEEAAEGCSFLVSSFRQGGMEARARDERIAVECGFAGQETIGPAGFAMAMRTVPEAVKQAAVVARLAPLAWIVSFTNPAGLVTQAVASHANSRVVGICDTPQELFHRIAAALGQRVEDLDFDYGGLNHLGWVRRIGYMGEDLMPLVMKNDVMLRSLYPADLFGQDFLRELGLLPTEYLFFYYREGAVLRNQRNLGVTRGEELRILNVEVLEQMARQLEAGDAPGALEIFRSYLNRRNASYLRLEGAGESALETEDPGWDPFEGATGYHRIAVEVIQALSSRSPAKIVLNVVNRNALKEFESDDVVEVPCLVDRTGAKPLALGKLPEAVRGLALAVKAHERQTIRAALSKSETEAILALSLHPLVREWDAAAKYWRLVSGGS